MNTAGTMEMLTATDASGEYLIPKIIVADAYASEMTAYADLDPPRHHLPRAPRLPEPARPPDLRARRRRGRHPLAGGRARPRRPPLPVGPARPRPPPRASPAWPSPTAAPPTATTPTTWSATSAAPASAPSPAGAATAAAQGRGAPNPDQLARYIANGGFWTGHVPEEAAFFKPWNAAYQDWAVATGLIDSPQPFLFQLYAEPLARFQAAALGKGDRQPPDAPARHPRPRHGAAAGLVSAPCGRARRPARPTRSTPSPSARPRCTIPGARRTPGSARSTARTRSTSPARSGTPSASRRATGPTSSPRTPASPSRSRAWTRRTRSPSGPGTPSASAPAPGRSTRARPRPPAASSSTTSSPSACPADASNSDPVTGQAAWYDLRVRLERVPARTRAAPQFPPQAASIAAADG